MVELRKKLKAYISYEMTPTTRGLLLEEEFAIGQRVICEGKIYESKNKLPSPFLEELILNRNAVVEEIEYVIYNGIEKIFGVRDTVSRTIFVDKTKTIRIRVLADDLSELMEKISTIKGVMASYGVIAKVCIWKRVGPLNTRINKPQPKEPSVKSEFNKEILSQQRELELKTAREAYA